MSTDDEIDYLTLDTRALAADAYAEMRRNAIRRAHRLRSKYLLATLVGLFTAIAAAARSARAMLRRVRKARSDRQAIARLHSLDDGALKDIGIRRSEIESVVHGHGADETRMRHPARLAA
jgi:uncharacterized protein YjiS (DUF1127 family)